AAVVAVADASAAGAAGRSRRRAGRFARHAEGTADLIDGFAAARWSALVEVVAGVTDVGRLARAGFRIASFASGIALDGVAFALTGVDITGVIAQIAVGVGTLFEFREAKGLVQRRKDLALGLETGTCGSDLTRPTGISRRANARERRARNLCKG